MHHRHRARRRHPWKFGWARRKPQPPWGHEPSERELAAPFHLQNSPAQLLPHADAAGGWMEGTMNGIGLLSLSCWNLILCFNLIGEKNLSVNVPVLGFPSKCGGGSRAREDRCCGGGHRQGSSPTSPHPPRSQQMCRKSQTCSLCAPKMPSPRENSNFPQEIRFYGFKLACAFCILFFF